MDRNGLGSAGCVVHVDVHALTISCVVGCYNAVATEHGRSRYGLSCTYAEAVECTSMACYSVSYVVKLYGC